jgi:hypothetical protein
MKSTIECYAALPANIFLCVTNDGYVRKENCDGVKANFSCESVSEWISIKVDSFVGVTDLYWTIKYAASVSAL